MKRYNIRDAENTDIEKLLEISARVTDTNSRHYLGDEIADNFLRSEFFTKEITDNIEKMKVIELEEKVIGLCVWKNNKLETLMIDCDYQGSGAAGYLLDETCKEKFMHYETLYLECFELNKRANAFYKKMGWTSYNRTKDEDLDIMRVLYKKVLNTY